jgi:hypothetical protein
LNSFARRRTTPAILLAGLLFAGCGDGDSGKIEYSREFEKPEGAGATATPNPNAGLSRSEVRRKDIEDSKHEPVGKGKGQRNK